MVKPGALASSLEWRVVLCQDRHATYAAPEPEVLPSQARHEVCGRHATKNSKRVIRAPAASKPSWRFPPTCGAAFSCTSCCRSKLTIRPRLPHHIH